MPQLLRSSGRAKAVSQKEKSNFQRMAGTRWPCSVASPNVEFLKCIQECHGVLNINNVKAKQILIQLELPPKKRLIIEVESVIAPFPSVSSSK